MRRILIIASFGLLMGFARSPRDLAGSRDTVISSSQQESASEGRLADAVLRLQGGTHGRTQKVRYRLVTLLGGKLTARVPV